jgi:hypothetical protein
MKAQKHILGFRKAMLAPLQDRALRLHIADYTSEPFSVNAIVGKFGKLKSAKTLKNPPRRGPKANPYFTIDPPLDRQSLPGLPSSRWILKSRADEEGLDYTATGKNSKGKPTVLTDVGCSYAALLSKTSKMSCVSFSLPAGGPSIAGTCPSAETISFTSLVSPTTHKTMLKTLPMYAARDGYAGEFVPDPIVEGNICEDCYSLKSNYANMNIQLYQIIRFAWCAQAIHDGTFVDLMTAAITHYQKNVAKRFQADIFKKKQEDPRYFRIHDSGDFFSKDYIKGWAEICRNLPHIRFWAPTRVWMLQRDALVAAMQTAPNLAIRPSALRFDDPAPSVPGLAGGSGAHALPKKQARTPFDPLNKGVAVWDCPAYTLNGHECRGSLDPERAEDHQREYNAAARRHFSELTRRQAPKDCRWCWHENDHSVSYLKH